MLVDDARHDELRQTVIENAVTYMSKRTEPHTSSSLARSLVVYKISQYPTNDERVNAYLFCKIDAS